MNTPLVKRAYNLGLKAVPNFAESLGEEQIAYYENHLDELPSALRRGFVLPGQSAEALQRSIKTSETDLGWWLGKAQEFSEKRLGVKIVLHERFVIPTELPWKSVIPVFDPGLTNREMVQKALKGHGLSVREETDVMKYAGSEANNAPTLHFIENSVKPNTDTMNMSPDQLRATGKSFLRLRGYGLAFALHHFATTEHLDPETFTWFPEDRLSGGGVAYGCWRSGGVGFRWDGADGRASHGGARVAMDVTLQP